MITQVEHNPSDPSAQVFSESQLKETQLYWFSYLDKLEIKLNELCSPAQKALIKIFKAGLDSHQTQYYQLFNSLQAQIEDMQLSSHEILYCGAVNLEIAFH